MSFFAMNWLSVFIFLKWLDMFLKRLNYLRSVGRCGNPSGRRSFNSARVRHHFFKTMYKLRCSESPSRDASSPGSPSTSEVNFKHLSSLFIKIPDSNKSSAAAVQLRRFHEAFRLSGTYLSAAAVESTDFFIRGTVTVFLRLFLMKWFSGHQFRSWKKNRVFATICQSPKTIR